MARNSSGNDVSSGQEMPTLGSQDISEPNGQGFVRPPRPAGLQRDLLLLYGALAVSVTFFALVGEGMKHHIPDGMFERKDGVLININDFDAVELGPYPKCHPHFEEYQHLNLNGTLEWRKIKEAPKGGPYGLGHPENPGWEVLAAKKMAKEVAEQRLTWKGLQPSLHLLIMASLAVVIGCKHSVWLFTEPAETREESAVLKDGDAYMFPITGSCVLFGLFCLYKYLGTDWIKFAVSSGIALMCTFSVSTNLDHLVAVWRGKVSPVLFVVPYLGENVTSVELFGLVLGLSMTVAYISTKNWIVNNILGISFCLCGIKMIGLSSYKTGTIMLIGLFFYDVFWVFGSKSVFGSNVMVTVATGVEAPIKLMFPRNLGGCGDLKFGMLGLGDIAVPGIFVAFLAKWDAMLLGRGKAASFVYLNVTMVAYVFSLITTVAVMLVFNAAQPALLYIVPYVVITSLTLALIRHEAKELFSVDIPDDEEGQTKDPKPQDKKDQ